MARLTPTGRDGASSAPRRAGEAPEPVRQALLAVLRFDSSEPARRHAPMLDGSGWQCLLDESKRQRVAALVNHRLKALGLAHLLPDRVAEGFSLAAHATARKMLGLHAALGSLLDQFDARGIPVILLKGAHLATQVYGNVGLRNMGDLDLLVPGNRLETAVAAVVSLGYAPSRPLRVEVDRATSQHMTRCVKRGAGAVEIHWNVTAPRQTHSIDVADLWERSVPIRVLGRRTRALCSEDLILHLCLHTSYQHLFGFGLQSLCDIGMVVDRPDPSVDWSALQQRARAWNWSPGVFLTLLLARDLLGAGIPDGVLDRLRRADFDPSLLQLATSRLFASPADLRAAGGEIARLAGQQTILDRCRHIRARVFIDRMQLAAALGRSADMSRAEQAFGYLARAIDLGRRHWRVAWRLARERDTSLARTAVDGQRLRTWLNS